MVAYPTTESTDTNCDIRVHPAADLFPTMDDDRFEELKRDIEKNGQKEPVVFWQNQLVDGRHRWRACQELGIPCSDCELAEDQDPVAYVLSANLHRRHLTESQRALVAAKLKDVYSDQAKARMVAGKKSDPMENLPQGTARDQAGKAMGVSGRSVDHASTVLKAGSPDLVKAVETGQVSVSRAAKIVKPTTPKPVDGVAALSANTGNRKADKAIRRIIPMIASLATSLDDIKAIDAAPTADDAAEWERELAEAISAINRFRRELKEVAK